MSVKDDCAVVVVVVEVVGGSSGRVVTVYLSNLGVFDNLEISRRWWGWDGEDLLPAFLDDGSGF
jgi:hypothetical protein